MNKPISCLISFGLCFTILLLPSSSESFRCGSEIVSRGDSTGNVLARCGSPEYKTSEPTKKTGEFSSDSVHRLKTTQRGSNYYTKGRSYTSGYYEEEETKVEHWFYNCGDHDFVYDLEFKNNILISEKTTTRGYGPSQCLSVAERMKQDSRKREEEIRQAQEQQEEFARQREEERKQFQKQMESYRPYPMGPNVQNAIPNVPVQPEKKPIEDTNKAESSNFYYCKDKNGNVTLSNIGCPE